jgi:NAD(P)-dependent dehydrogenase (short-subunit alcohol dehydrogenase family)
MKRFDGKVVLVTGGGGAIGSATAERFAQEGAKVILVDKNLAAATDTGDNLRRKLGTPILVIGADVTIEEDVAGVVERSIGEFSGIDILFNNAGINGARAPVYELPVSEWDDVIRINLRSQFLVLRQVLKAMIRTKRGQAVVNMSSSLAQSDVHTGGASYAASKHGVLGLTRAAAIDAARFGIRVNAVCPGIIETALSIVASDPEARRADIEYRANRTPLGRLGQPADVAALVTFLCSNDARHVTGVGWLIDGGQTIQSWSTAPRTGAYPQGF